MRDQYIWFLLGLICTAFTLSAAEPSASSGQSKIRPLKTQNPVAKGQTWIAMGTGMGEMHFRQSIEDSGSFEQRAGLSWSQSFEAGHFTPVGWGLQASYSALPIDIQTGQRQSSFDWTTVGLYGLKRWSMRRQAFTLKTGVERQWSPFFMYGESLEIEQVALTTTSAVLGGSADMKRGDWTGSTGIEMAVPFSMQTNNGSSYRLRDQLSIDAWVGAFYNIDAALKLGAFVAGEWRTFAFDYRGANESYSSAQTLTSTKLDLRVGLDF